MKLDWITETRYRILEDLKNSDKGLNQRNISKNIEVKDSTVSRAADKLQSLGFIDRDKNLVYHITPEGEKAVEKLAKISSLSKQNLEGEE